MKVEYARPEFAYCIKCGIKFSTETVRTCSKCNWMQCPKKHCLCSLTKEARKAAVAMWNTYRPVVFKAAEIAAQIYFSVDMREDFSRDSR